MCNFQIFFHETFEPTIKQHTDQFITVIGSLLLRTLRSRVISCKNTAPIIAK